MVLLMTAREKLKQWRDKLCWTQDQAASKLGVTARTYQRWERGEGIPTRSAAMRIQKQSGVKVAEWYAQAA